MHIEINGSFEIGYELDAYLYNWVFLLLDSLNYLPTLYSYCPTLSFINLHSSIIIRLYQSLANLKPINVLAFTFIRQPHLMRYSNVGKLELCVTTEGIACGWCSKNKGSVAHEYLVLKVMVEFFYLFTLTVPLTRKIYLNTHLPQILVSANILFINREECAMVLYTMIKGPLLTVV